MKTSIWNLKRPFFWSLVLSGLSLVCLQLAVVMFRQGLRRPGFFLALAGMICLLAEVILFVPVLARNALRSAGLSILFRITQPGWIYIGLIFLIAIAAVNTGNNLLYIVLAFMISAIAVSGELSRILLSSLRVAVDYQDSIFAGEFTSYRLRLLNAKRWFPAFSVGVEGRLVNKTWLAGAGLADAKPKRLDAQALQARGVPCMRTVAYFPYLPPRGTDAQSFQVRFQHRGLYRIDAIEVLTAFPFGFFRKGRKIQATGELVVYPELLEKSDFQSCLEHQLETIPILRKGLGAELFALREYVPGEDVRHIHWKASARAGRYLVKEYATETLQSYVLVLDEGYPARWTMCGRATSGPCPFWPRWPWSCTSAASMCGSCPVTAARRQRARAATCRSFWKIWPCRTSGRWMRRPARIPSTASPLKPGCPRNRRAA